MSEVRIATRWTDFDALGHVTHAAYPVYLDEARDLYLRERVGDFGDWPYVIRHVSIDFEREIAHPTREVVVRTRVAEIGRSSVTFEQEVLAPDADDPAATARAVVVAWDPATRGSRAVGDDARERILRAAQ